MTTRATHTPLTWLLLSTLLVLLSAPLALAADASFSWLPNTETNLKGYRIHYGNSSSRNYTTTVDVGLPALGADSRVHYTITGLTPGTTYYFAATAYDTDGLESDYSTEVVWTAPSDSGGSNTVPVARLAATPVTGTAPLEVSFDASASSDADGDPLTYVWTSGDGASSWTTNSSHTTYTYSTAGSFTATLQVDDGTARSPAVTVSINVTPATSGGSGSTAPQASIGVDTTTGQVPLTVSFNGKGSTASTATGKIEQYAWSFGDGATGSGETPQHTYTAAGTYTATLTVTDDQNRQDQTSIVITATSAGSSSNDSSTHQTTPSSREAAIASSLLPIYQLLLLK